MKFFLGAIFLVFSMNLFAEDAIKFLENTIHKNKNNIFYNGIDYIKLGEFVNTPSVTIESKGNNSGELLTQKDGQLVKLYALVNTNLSFESYTLTFTFISPNGVENSFNCLAVDQFNCGKIELRNCTKSHLGYSFREKDQIFTYDSDKSLNCENKVAKNNNQGRLPSSKNEPAGQKSKNSKRNNAEK
jgi:hypothetical protein